MSKQKYMTFFKYKFRNLLHKTAGTSLIRFLRKMGHIIISSFIKIGESIKFSSYLKTDFQQHFTYFHNFKNNFFRKHTHTYIYMYMHACMYILHTYCL